MPSGFSTIAMFACWKRFAFAGWIFIHCDSVRLEYAVIALCFVFATELVFKIWWRGHNLISTYFYTIIEHYLEFMLYETETQT